MQMTEVFKICDSRVNLESNNSSILNSTANVLSASVRSSFWRLRWFIATDNLPCFLACRARNCKALALSDRCSVRCSRVNIVFCRRKMAMSTFLRGKKLMC